MYLPILVLHHTKLVSLNTTSQPHFTSVSIVFPILKILSALHLYFHSIIFAVVKYLGIFYPLSSTLILYPLLREGHYSPLSFETLLDQTHTKKVHFQQSLGIKSKALNYSLPEAGDLPYSPLFSSI